MSDFSLLFKKYNSVSRMTESLNNSVITLKRRLLTLKPEIKSKHPNLEVSGDEVSKAQADIIEILSALENFYKNQNVGSELYELMDNSLFQSEILLNAEFKAAITTVLGKIKTDKELSTKELSQLDKFVSILDNEAGVLFKKLRSNRG